ncbi:AraC family transcriptional regulator [Nonomuraea recticatena]|uniref:AraC family transcriptional regulator n=1 Tax=Nonomuraea recticatena TaxID=46178 RepID=A0ABP6FAI0_9ACTN
MSSKVRNPPRPAGIRAPASWAGAASAAPGLLVFTGEIGSAASHAHAAVQVLLVLEGEVLLTDRRGRRRHVSAAVIPAGARHELSSTAGAHGLLAYLDPAGRAGRAATALVASSGDPGEVETWQAAAQPQAGEPADAVSPVSAVLCPAAQPEERAGLPVALAGALEAIPQLISGPLLLEELAARVGLSASRLGHLFAEHLHLPYPAWRRWARLLHAMEAVRGGATLTDAAHRAGFADSSHLTRACREMFGLAPSHLLHTIRPATADAT